MDKLIEQPKKQSDFFNQVFFFLLGVSSLSGWNAVLTGLNYFAEKFPNYDVNFIMPIPNFIALVIVGGSLPKLSLYLTLNFRIGWSLIFLSAAMVGLPIVGAVMPNDAGFYISLLFTFFMGACNSMQQNSSIGIASLLGYQYVNIFFTGTGFSGLIICIFRMISLVAIDQSDPANSILLYFGVAAAWNFITVVMYFKFTKTASYRKINKAHQKGRRSMLADDSLVPETINKEPVINNSIMDDGEQQSASQVRDTMRQSADVLQTDIDLLMKEHNKQHEGHHHTPIEKMSILQTLIWINKVAFPIPLMIIVVYICTFIMYPGLALGVQFDKDFIDWGITLIIFWYNVGDTLGKIIAGWSFLYNQTILIVITMGRFAFLWPYIAMFQGQITNQYIYYANTLLFATLNGFVTTGFMQLGPQKTKEGFIKEKIGFVQGFSLCLGIMIGTFLALPFSKLKKN